MSFKEFNKNKSGNKRKSNKRFSKTNKFRKKTKDNFKSKNFNNSSKQKFGSQKKSYSKKGFARKKEFVAPRHEKERFIPIKFPNTYLHIKKRGLDLFTKNLSPGKNYFDESIIFKEFDKNKIELRNWDYTRSKLGAAIALKISQLGINDASTVLYLGASHGFTPSFVSDMVGKEGFVFCLDFAPRVVRDLYALCETRNNMAPIIGDANKPETYEHLIPKVDVVFMDIAQRNQVDIFLKNLKFLKKGGFGLLALKARSVDVTKKPKRVFKDARAELEKHITIVDYRELDPYEKDHCFFVCKKK
jgi:fibrillarin-like pre-rRNA processing protein